MAKFKDIKDYIIRSSDKELNKNFEKEKNTEKEKNNKYYYQIGSLQKGSSYYKYLPYKRALECLEKSIITFVEPSSWDDTYESLYYEADYDNVAPEYKEHPRLFATCVTNKKYDEAAWRIYSEQDKTCVQFEIDRFNFRYQLLKAIKDKDRIYEGAVQYLYKGYIENIYKKKLKNNKNEPEKDNSLYKKFISNENYFTRKNYLNLLLLKRRDFIHENETRFFIIRKKDIEHEAKKAIKIPDGINNDQKIPKGKLYILKNIRWIDIIKRVTINRSKDSEEFKKLQEIINKTIDNSEKDKKNKDIELIPYSVYGEKQDRIKIEA
ncbi:MAG: hypothetical protein IJK61_07535 [Bacteroidetes bacterium]|nr:hypothetical protein [Bacteroidota bacterium]